MQNNKRLFIVTTSRLNSKIISDDNQILPYISIKNHYQLTLLWEKNNSIRNAHYMQTTHTHTHTHTLSLSLSLSLMSRVSLTIRSIWQSPKALKWNKTPKF